jgi:chromosome segregation ATPase
MPLGAGEPAPSASPSTVSHVTTTGIDADTVLALADNAASKAEMAVTAYQTLARVADAQVRQARRGARVAWAAVAIMVVGVTGAVGWATHRLTRTSVELDEMQRNIAAADETNRSLSAKWESALVAHDAAQKSLRAEHQTIENTLRTELSSAKTQAAHAEGQLAAYKEQANAALAQVAAHRTSDTLPRKAESLASTTRPTTAPSSDTQASTSDHEEEP